MSDPLDVLLGTTIRQKAWAILCAHADDWVCSGVEFNREAALEEMKVQQESLPALAFKIARCTISVGVQKKIGTGNNGFSKGERVRLTTEGRKHVRPRSGDVLGTVAGAGKKAGFVTVRWDGQKSNCGQIYAVKFIEKVSP